ncbi:hypothetical protein FRC11_003448, partial [Ceratobasidium sp. 423]
HMHFVGEAISTIHGWVAGAIESANRGVWQLLELNSGAGPQSRGSKETGSAMVAAVLDDSQTARSRKEIFEKFDKKWRDHIGIEPRLFTGQLQISRTLQIDQFGLSPAFEVK